MAGKETNFRAWKRSQRRRDARSWGAGESSNARILELYGTDKREEGEKWINLIFIIIIIIIND